MIGTALRLLLVLTALTGVVYPLFVTLIGQIAFHYRANGSPITVNEHVVGYQNIGQQFLDKKYFWPRPSAVNYQPYPSGASNLGTTEMALKKIVDERVMKLSESHAGSTINTIPSDLLYSSASGVDPHISLKAALFQVDRVAKARNLSEGSESRIKELVEAFAKQHPENFVVGRYVNVLELNIALDELK